MIRLYNIVSTVNENNRRLREKEIEEEEVDKKGQKEAQNLILPGSMSEPWESDLQCKIDRSPSRTLNRPCVFY